MSGPAFKKAKTDNRKFNEDWKVDFFFISPNGKQAKPTCLICGCTVTMMKKHDIQRHYNTKHKLTFEEKYPPGSESRKKKLSFLIKSHEGSSKLLVRSATLEEKSTEVSLRVSWILNKNKLPFATSEVVKKCIVESAKVLCPDKVDTFEKIPLSNDTNTRRTRVMSDSVKDELIGKLKNANCISLAIDESTDITDIAQLSLFVRFLDEAAGIFKEELLALLPLTGSTRGEDIFNAIHGYFQDNDIPINNVRSLVTDGAPAMLGRTVGVAARLKQVCPGLLTFHCIIHNSVLCSKLNAELAAPLDKLIQVVNFLRAKSAKQHRELKSFLKEHEAAYCDVPLHTAVRWLSKGQVLRRMWTLRDEICSFLQTLDKRQAQEYHEFLVDKEEMTILAFLVDIFAHLNVLNLKLQGKGMSLADARKAVKAFQTKLGIFRTDLANDMEYFETLKQYAPDADTSQFVDFIDKIAEEFNTRFAEFRNIDSLLLVVKRPFLVDVTDENWMTQAATIFPQFSRVSLQSQLIELQADDELKLHFSREAAEDFWISLNPTDFGVLRHMALNILTIFGTTYICEQCFSNMNMIKNKYRSRLTNRHLEDITRIATTSYVPKFSEIAQGGKCNFSH